MRCHDGYCGAEDCENCHSGCTREAWIESRSDTLAEGICSFLRWQWCVDHDFLLTSYETVQACEAEITALAERLAEKEWEERT